VEIIQFLSKYHGKVISQRTLHRRPREYGLNRRTPRYDIDEIEEEVRADLHDTWQMWATVR